MISLVQRLCPEDVAATPEIANLFSGIPAQAAATAASSSGSSSGGPVPAAGPVPAVADPDAESGTRR